MNTFIIILVSEKQIFPSMPQVFPGICFRVTGPSLIICTRMDSFNWNLHCELQESKAFWLSWFCSQSQTIFTPANSHNRYERRSRITMWRCLPWNWEVLFLKCKLKTSQPSLLSTSDCREVACEGRERRKWGGVLVRGTWGGSTPTPRMRQLHS